MPGNGAGQLAASPPLQLLNEAAPATTEPEPEPEPAKHVPVAETPPPAGRKPGKIEVTSGKPGKSKEWSQSTGPVSSSGKSKIRLETEARRPDLRQTIDPNLNDGLDSLPPFDR
jgi:hypothetical protein